MKKLLILNGSFCELPIIQKAKEMGYYVITTGNAPELIGHQYADEYIPADYSDKERILEIVKENDIYRVISCANDFGVITASYVSEQMGWEGQDSYETVLTIHHKDKFKKFTEEYDIPSPRSVVFTKQEDAEDYAKTAEYPIIVKANDLTGGKGIMKAENLEEAIEALKNAFTKSREKQIVVEPFIRGTQHSYIAFLANNKIVTSTSCNCYSPINPYLIQAETFPADHIDEIQPKLDAIIMKMCDVLKLKDGIICLQYILRDGEIFVIESMRRPFGNQLTMILGQMTGFSWEEGHIKSQIGEDCTGIEIKEPPMKYCGHHGIMTRRNGKIKDYHIPESIQKHLFKKIDMLQPGEEITDYLNQRIAYLYYSYENRDEMNKEVKQYNDLIKIELESVE